MRVSTNRADELEIKTKVPGEKSSVYVSRSPREKGTHSVWKVDGMHSQDLTKCTKSQKWTWSSRLLKNWEKIMSRQYIVILLL